MNSKKPLQQLTFLVLADIHFGLLADSPEFKLNGQQASNATSKRLSRRDSLINTILKLPNKPTAILVPGDLTSMASPSEFKACVAMTLSIADDLAISHQNIFFTYGNHDTNWRICELGVETERFAADEHYGHIAATIGSLYAPVNNCVAEGPIPGSGVFSIGDNVLFILNSGFFCSAEQSYRHGRLGIEQLAWFKEIIAKYKLVSCWKILMMHHHPFNYTYPSPIEDVSCIEEGAEVIDLSGRYGIDLLCHGHRHHPRIFTDFRTDWKNPMTFICAGSLAVNAVHRDNGLIPNLFHVVSLHKRLPNGAAFGNVTSFEFTTEGWTAIRNSPATPLDHVHWFGSLVSDSEIKEALSLFLENILRPECSNVVMMPPREKLPPELLCCSLDRLKDNLSSLAQTFGYRVVGRYPDDVSLIRKT